MTICSEFFYTVRILMYLCTTFNCYNSDKTLLRTTLRRNYYKTHAFGVRFVIVASSLLISYTNSQSCFIPILWFPDICSKMDPKMFLSSRELYVRETRDLYQHNLNKPSNVYCKHVKSWWH